MLDCKQAALLVTKKLDGKLTFWEHFRLKMHLLNCKFCYNFDIQSEKIDGILKATPDELSKKCCKNHRMDENKKNKIIQQLTKIQ